ncbi:hypothetical protein ACWDXH_11510 [Micromonospora chokoriensis]
MSNKTRGGVYADALKMFRCVTEPAVTTWVAPPNRYGVREFDPATFLTSLRAVPAFQKRTRLPHPLVVALTDTVLGVGELRAGAGTQSQDRQPGGDQTARLAK